MNGLSADTVGQHFTPMVGLRPRRFTPELVLAAKRLHRRSPKGHRRSLREIAFELAAAGLREQEGRVVLSLVSQLL